MTRVRTVSIPDDVDCFDKLNNMTPSNMGFSEQVRLAVNTFVQKGNIDEYLIDKIPLYDAPIEQWIEYIKKHPEHVGEMMRRNAQLRNILLKEEYVI